MKKILAAFFLIYSTTLYPQGGVFKDSLAFLPLKKSLSLIGEQSTDESSLNKINSSLRDYEYPFLTNYLLILNPNLSFVNTNSSRQSFINNTSTRSTTLSLDARFSLMSNRKHKQTELLVLTNNAFRRNKSKGTVDFEEKLNNTTSLVDFKTKSFNEEFYFERAFTYTHHHKYYIEKAIPAGGSSNTLNYEKWYIQKFAPQLSVGKGRTHIVTYLILAKNIHDIIFDRLGIRIYSDKAEESKFADEIARIRTKNNGINRYNTDFQRTELIELLRSYDLTVEQILNVLSKLEDHWFNDVVFQRLRGTSFSLGLKALIDYDSRINQRVDKLYGNSFISSFHYHFPISTKSQFDLSIIMNLFQKEYEAWSEFIRYPTFEFRGGSDITLNVDYLYFINAQTYLRAYLGNELSLLDEPEQPSANNLIFAGLSANRFIANQILLFGTIDYRASSLLNSRSMGITARAVDQRFTFNTGLRFYLF